MLNNFLHSATGGLVKGSFTEKEQMGRSTVSVHDENKLTDPGLEHGGTNSLGESVPSSHNQPIYSI